MIGLEGGTPCHGLHQSKRVKAAADGSRVGDFQEFLSGVGARAHWRFDIAVENLDGHIGEQLLRRLQQVRVQRRYRRRLTTENERAGLQGLLDFALQLGRKFGGAVKLAGAVVLDLLVGFVAVQFSDALAAIDLVGQVVQLGVGAGQ